MAYQKIPGGSNPLADLTEALKEDSRYVPNVSLLFVSQAGALAMFGSSDGTSLRFPQGKVYRPKSAAWKQTAMDKVEDTARARVNGMLGPLVTVIPEEIALVPYLKRHDIEINGFDKKLYPKAIGKLTQPVVVPVEVEGDDPQQRFRVTWASPDDALDIMQTNFREFRGITSKLTIETLEVSLPTLTETILTRP